MNSYPDPTPAMAEPLPFGEPEYREYFPAPPQPRAPIYPPGTAGPGPVARGPMQPTRPVQPVPYGAPPYPYNPNTQAFQPVPQQMPPFPVAKKGSRGWIIVLGTIGAAILILASVLIFAFSRLSSSNSSAPETTLAGTTISRPGLVSLGQSISIGGITATALSVSPLEGDGTTNPAAGNKYEVVSMRLQNNENDLLYYTPNDFHVFNGDNHEHDVEEIVPDTYTANQQLAEGTLDPNGEVEGDLIIQVPVNDHNVKLSWSPGTVTSDSEYEWNLGL
jgi:Domain of unknown function (DUF4352)